jgi:hypothetical protein
MPVGKVVQATIILRLKMRDLQGPRTCSTSPMIVLFSTRVHVHATFTTRPGLFRLRTWNMSYLTTNDAMRIFRGRYISTLANTSDYGVML